MNETETYLAHEQVLIVDAQDTQHAVYAAKTNYKKLCRQVEWRLIGTSVGIFVSACISVSFGKVMSNI